MTWINAKTWLTEAHARRYADAMREIAEAPDDDTRREIAARFRADNEGEVSLAHLPPGRYTLTLHADGSADLGAAFPTPPDA